MPDLSQIPTRKLVDAIFAVLFDTMSQSSHRRDFELLDSNMIDGVDGVLCFNAVEELKRRTQGRQNVSVLVFDDMRTHIGETLTAYPLSYGDSAMLHGKPIMSNGKD